MLRIIYILPLFSSLRKQLGGETVGNCVSNSLAYKISKECIASYACNNSSTVSAFLQDASVFRMSMAFVLPPQMTGFTAFPSAATEISKRSHSEAALSDEKRIPNIIILKRFPLSEPLGLGCACGSDPTNPGRQSSEALLKLTNLKGPLCHPSEVEQVNSIPSALVRQ